MNRTKEKSAWHLLLSCADDVIWNQTLRDSNLAMEFEFSSEHGRDEGGYTGQWSHFTSLEMETDRRELSLNIHNNDT